MNRDLLIGVLHQAESFQVELCERIDSTNRRLFDRAVSGEQEWTVLIAEEQTEGRGRAGRRWASAPGLGLWFSVLLRPAVSGKELNLLNLFTAYCLAQFIEAHVRENAGLSLRIDLKWPNDLLVGGQKLAGILTEANFIGDTPDFAVVGIGLNVNHRREEFPAAVRPLATSLQQATGRIWPREQLLGGFLNFYRDAYRKYFPENTGCILELYKTRLRSLGRDVTVHVGEKLVRGTFRDLTAEGYMVMERQGAHHVITTGDVQA